MKKVTANLHVTTLGHGYMSWEHTDHKCEWLSYKTKLGLLMRDDDGEK